MPASLHLLFPQALPQIRRYSQDLMARIAAAGAYAWVRPILVQAGIEVVERARVFAVGWGRRCVSLFSYFATSDVL